MTKAPEIETALLGRAIMEPNFVLPEIINLLEPKHFYNDFNKILFACLKAMFGKYHIDALTVSFTLSKRHEKKAIALPYKSSIEYMVTSTITPVTGLEEPAYYATILRECYANRRMQTLAASFQDATYMSENLQQIQDELEELHKMDIQKSDWKTMDEMITGLMQYTEDQKGRVKLATGFSKLDNNVGIGPGDLVVIGARPSVGKSAFMGQLAKNMAKSGQAVGIISLEMTNEAVAARLASIETNIPFERIYTGLQQDENEKQRFYTHISRTMTNLPIFVSDNTDADMMQIKIKTTKLVREHGAKCLIVDYLQLIPVKDNKNTNRQEQISKISRGCKLLAKELKIAIILLAQVNRSATNLKGPERYPQLHQLRESGAIEQDADIVLFIHRDYALGIMADEDGNSTLDQADLICRKWRNSAPFHQKLKFDGPTMQFMEGFEQDYTKTFFEPTGKGSALANFDNGDDF